MSVALGEYQGSKTTPPFDHPCSSFCKEGGRVGFATAEWEPNNYLLEPSRLGMDRVGKPLARTVISVQPTQFTISRKIGIQGTQTGLDCHQFLTKFSPMKQFVQGVHG